MDAWAVIGDLDSGSPGKLEWRHGVLTGTTEALAAVDALVERGGGQVAMTPTGPWIPADRGDAAAAYVLAYSVFTNMELVDGEAPVLPELEELPEDAIA